MKRIFILLLFPVCAFAQVSMNVEPVDLVSPGDDKSFLRVEFTSHEPVRIEECTIEFYDDRIFDFVDRFALYKDSIALPVLSNASTSLFNPWEHYPGVYVGIGSDTLVSLDYRIDTYRHYSRDLDIQFSCRINYYTDPGRPDTVIGPVTVSSNTVLSVEDDYREDIFNVRNIPYGLDIHINTRLCDPVYIVDISGKVVDYVYISRRVYLKPGLYILSAGTQKYIGTYIVM